MKTNSHLRIYSPLISFFQRALALLLVLAPIDPLSAQVPQLLNYQGRVAVGTTAFTGTGQFKFALVSTTGSTSYWSNDGTSTAGSQPTLAVSLTVTTGLYALLLGDTSLTNMTAIPNAVFSNSDVRLRVWFNDGTNGFQLLTPDQRIASVGYAVMAGNVPDGAITTAKLAAGAVTATNIASGSITGTKLAAATITSANIATGAIGSSQLASGAVTSAQLAAGAVTAATIANGSITNTQLATGSVTSTTIAAGAVNASHIASGAVTSAQLATDAVIGNSIASATITGAKIAPGTITSAHLANSAIGTAQIANGAVGAAQLAPGAVAANLAGSGQTGVPSGGLVLSVDGANAALVNAGYVKIGATTLAETWQTQVNGTVPTARSRHMAVWTGSEMIVWGGVDFSSNYLNDGGRYDPVANSWTLVAANGLTPRLSPAAVWTGTEMIIWGGSAGTTYFADGARFNPATNTWVPMATQGAPPAASAPRAVWTGTVMIVWGGSGNGGAPLNTGGCYNVAFNAWAPVTTNNAPPASFSGPAVWTGTEMIVWGGYTGVVNSPTSNLNVGGRYDPVLNSWTTLPSGGAPVGRRLHVMVWTGSELIVWGGAGDSGILGDGARLNLSSGSWTAISSNGAPAARYLLPVVWTGTEMMVWGGNGALAFNDGGRYNPATDTWTPIASTAATTGRYRHTAVWTGAEMIIWGGINATSAFNDTLRYAPSKVMYLYQRP